MPFFGIVMHAVLYIYILVGGLDFFILTFLYKNIIAKVSQHRYFRLFLTLPLQKEGQSSVMWMPCGTKATKKLQKKTSQCCFFVKKSCHLACVLRHPLQVIWKKWAGKAEGVVMVYQPTMGKSPQIAALISYFSIYLVLT